MLSRIYTVDYFKAPALEKIAERIAGYTQHRLVFWLLAILGVVRALLVFFAYPPAHGADGITYFLQAERLHSGLDAPLLSQLAHPFYPVWILVTFKWMGSIYWLIGLQMLMSASLGVLYYRALKHLNSTLALLIALVILGDMQVAVLFNFISTEPLYIFLMAVVLNLFITRIDAKTTARWSFWYVVIGVLLAALMFTRPVGRYLIVLFVAIACLRTLRWRAGVLMLVGFAGVLGLQDLVSQTALQQSEGTSTGDFLIVNIIRGEREAWIAPQNGPYSTRMLAVGEQCGNLSIYCLQQEIPDWNEMMVVINGTVRETISVHWADYIGLIWQETMQFLSISGRQYDQLPSEIQCARPLEAIYNETQDRDAVIASAVWGRYLSDYSEAGLTHLRELLIPIYRAMCPPISSVPTLKSAVDWIAERYRSLGRPQPHLWYGSLLVLTFAIPWTRRFGTAVLIAGSVLLYHALVSAVVVNVQPRYVSVTNPLRAVLLGILVYIVFKLAAYTLDWFLARRL